MSRYAVNLSEYELHEQEMVVNKFAAPCTYESQGNVLLEKNETLKIRISREAVAAIQQ